MSPINIKIQIKKSAGAALTLLALFASTSMEHCDAAAAVSPDAIDAAITAGVPSSSGTCGNGNRGNGICSDGKCCSKWGWCGSSHEHCSGMIITGMLRGNSNNATEEGLDRDLDLETEVQVDVHVLDLIDEPNDNEDDDWMWNNTNTIDGNIDDEDEPAITAKESYIDDALAFELELQLAAMDVDVEVDVDTDIDIDQNVRKQTEAFEADDVVELRVDNGVHWMSYNTEWTQELVGGHVLKWKETRRHANVIYLEDKNGREGAMTRFDFNDKTVLYCAAVNGKCKVTGTISVWYKRNRFGVDARDITGLNEGYDGEYWQSDGKNQWTEFDGNGYFHWEESHRDINSIYLKDKNGRDFYTARLDLFNAKVMLCDSRLEVGKECFSLGSITDVW